MAGRTIVKGFAWAVAAVLTSGVAAMSPAYAHEARTHVVCPEQSEATARSGFQTRSQVDRTGCAYRGSKGLQAAIDAAASGDEILIKAGRYVPEAYRDVPYKIHTIRAMAVIDGKDLRVRGEEGAVLDGTSGLPTTAIIVHRGEVEIAGLTITGFRYAVEEDEIYEGHGIFVIDGKARIDDVTISKYQKMALTGRGTSLLDVTNLRILDGHVAIWLDESAHLRLSQALIRGNDSAGIAAYGNATAHVFDSVFDGNLDDGLYTEQEAALYASNTLFLRNKPYAARATEHSRIWLGYSGLHGNEAVAIAKDAAQVRRGPNLIEGELKLGKDYRPQPGSPLSGKADPNLGPDSQIGLY